MAQAGALAQAPSFCRASSCRRSSARGAAQLGW
jgi:hypothetical protein